MYLKPNEYKLLNKKVTPVFPFGFNLSQQEATKKALSEKVCIIEGPPGTGKTQTILNIIANAVLNNKTVAVVSNNNEATSNVFEKLEKYGVSFIAAPLGNKENINNFFANKPTGYPDLKEWEMPALEYVTLEKDLHVRSLELSKLLSLKNDAAKLQQLINELLLEKTYFDSFRQEKYGERLHYKSFRHHNSEAAIKLWQEFEKYEQQDKNLGIILKIKNLINYGIYSRSFYKNSPSSIIGCFQHIFYEEWSKELKKTLRSIEEQLNKDDCEKKMQKYVDDSIKLLKASLADKFYKKERKDFNSKTFKGPLFKDFIDEYPVILSTTHSLRNSIQEGYLFDYLIIDEASQVDILSGALSLSCARKVTVVGDQMQLEPVIDSDTEEYTDKVFNEYKLNESYRYSEQSLLSSFVNIFDRAPKIRLKEHYRCHPQIINFCNKRFYQDELIIMTHGEAGDKPLTVYKTQPGNHARDNYNQRQIDILRKEIFPGQNNWANIGVISPYRNQVNKIEEAFGKDCINVNTVHKYQGREKETIALTTVVNEVKHQRREKETVVNKRKPFVDSSNLINVAVSRASKKFILLVSDKIEGSKSNLGDLIGYIRYNNGDIIKSEIHSIFDFLYQAYSKEHFKKIKKYKKVSKYKSENLMNIIIERVLDNQKFSHLYHSVNIRLNDLIKNPAKLNEKELTFVKKSSLDFVIYSRVDKLPVLIIEVDGYAFHEAKPEQHERDRMKNGILENYNLPIIRFKTNGSGEEDRLKRKLDEILKGV